MTIDASLNERLRKVERKHGKMRRNGVVHKVGRDGLIRSRPRLIRPQVPFKGLLLIVALLITFKSLLFAQIGAGNYALRVDALREGTTLEQMGAFVMQEDPVTVALGGYLKQYFFQR
ncbi:hypothetical protein [Pseudooctadecabacter sp.]|uniref:hypothetical protein n=1 Tax=Pseudooctadecabacter sp. TaxID=1966338 RepID=UPI0035C78E0A